MANKVQILFETVGADKVSASFKEASSGATGLSASMDKLAIGAAAGVASFAALAAAGTASAAVYRAFSSEISGLASTLRKAEVEFTALTGSVAEAEKRVESLYRFAQQTPFETKSILDAARGLEAIGLKAGDAETALRMIGEAAAGTGTEVEKVATAYGRVVAAFESGQGIAQAVNSFRDLGVLTAAEATEITRLAQSADTAQQAFDQLNRKMAEFGGSMDQQMNTIPALMTRLFDAIDRLVGDAFEPLIAVSKDALRALIAFATDDSVKQWAVGVGTAIQSVITAFTTFVLDLKRGVRSIGVPLAYMGSLFADLGNLQIPSFERAASAAAAATTKLDADMKRIGESMTLLSKEQRAARDEMDSLVKSVDSYVTKMPQLGEVTRKVATDTDALRKAQADLKAEMANATEAWRDYDRLIASAGDALREMETPLRTTGELTKGMGLALKEADLETFTTNLIEATRALDEIAQESTDWQTAVALLNNDIGILTAELGGFKDVLAFLTDDVRVITGVFKSWPKDVGDAATATAILTDSIDELSAASKKAASDTSWKKFGDGLKGIFESVGDTFEKITTGLIQGTLDIDDAFKNLGQSLLINFSRTIFDAILDEAEVFVDDFIDTIVNGLQNFDWGGFFSDLFSFVGGFFGGSGGGGGGGGDWWDDLDFYAHGGRVRRTGPAVLHEGETVVPADFGGGWRSSGFPGFQSPGGGGRGGTIPVHVENVDAFGQQFGTWAGRVISATPLALQGIGMLTGNAAIGGIGSGLGIRGALSTGYNMFTNAPNVPGAWAPGVSSGAMGPFNTGWSAQNMASLVSGVGSIMSMVGGFTGIQGLNYAGMGIQGAVLATQIVSSLVPQVASAIASLGASVGASVGGSVGSWASSAIGSLGGISAGALGGGAIMAIPALAGFLANQGQAEKTWRGVVRREEGAILGGDMATRQGAVRTRADLNRPEIRSDLALIAASVQAIIAPTQQQIDTMVAAQDRGEGNFQDLINMNQGQITLYNRFMAGVSALGISPDVQRLEEGGTRRHVPEGPLGFYSEDVLRTWIAIFEKMASGTADVAESTEDLSVASDSVAQNQANLILKYGGTVEALRQISTQLDLGVDIPEIIKLTKEQLDFLGTATGQQIEDMIKGWKTSIADAIMKDPVKLTSLLPMENFKREGESLEQTTERVAASLFGLGEMMKAVDQEIVALKSGGLTLATNSFKSIIADVNDGLEAAVTKFEESSIRLDESGKLIGDPTAMLEAAVSAHDALIARYEAEMALIAQIIGAIDQLGAGANALAGTAARLQELGVMPAGGMEFVSWLSEVTSAFFAGGPGGGGVAMGGVPGAVAVGPDGIAMGGVPGLQAEGVGPSAFATPEMALAAGRGAVGVFATQSMMAARSMDLAGMESAMRSAGNLITGFTATIDQINQIQDPSERMRLLTEALGQVGAATEAAANAAITYWTTLHDVVAGMMEQLNTIASSIAGAGGSIAGNADWLMKAGVDVKALGTDILALIDLFPTMGAKLELLGSGIQTFLAGISESAMRDLNEIAIRYRAATPGSTQQADFASQLTTAFQPILTGFFNAFQAAMALQDPGQRLSALTAIMDNIGNFLGGLPPEMADALVAIFGPEIRTLVTAIQTTSAAQAAAAAAVAAEMKAIIGDRALSPENFLLLTVQGIKDSLALIVEHAGPLFVAISESMVAAGTGISEAIGIAGTALSDALGGFKTPAEQLSASLTVLSNTIEEKMRRAVEDGINNALSGSAQSGMSHVPETGLYMLHQGEGVLTAEQNAAFNRGMLGSYASGTFVTASTARSMMTLLQGISTAMTTVMPQGFTAITAAWTVAGQAYGMLIEKLGAGWDIVGSAYANLISVITAGWGAMPAIMAEAVTVGINEALSARGLAAGTDYVPSTGLYMLHQGEAVIPAGQNYEHAGTSGGGVTVTLSFGDIHLARGGRQEAEELITAVESSIQSGRLRQAVQRATAGQV